MQLSKSMSFPSFSKEPHANYFSGFLNFSVCRIFKVIFFSTFIPIVQSQNIYVCESRRAFKKSQTFSRKIAVFFFSKKKKCKNKSNTKIQNKQM